MRAVKFAAPILVLLSLAFTACNTLYTRRELYSPGEGSGVYSEALETGSWRRGEYREVRVVKKVEAPVPPVMPEPAEPALVQ